MLCVGKFTVILLSAIFLTLIVCYVQSVAADHTEPGDGIYKNYGDANIVTTKDSEYQVHLQLILRTNDGQLINITESSGSGAYIPHEITDHVFDTLMGEKEIVTIDNVKYEKVQFVSSYDFLEWPSSFIGIWYFNICGDIGGHSNVCVPIFHANTASMYVEEGDDIKNHWTILREMN